MRKPNDPRRGERVLLARRCKGWNQGDLARETMMSRTVISPLEKGRQQVNAERLRTLAPALGISFVALSCHGLWCINLSLIFGHSWEKPRYGKNARLL